MSGDQIAGSVFLSLMLLLMLNALVVRRPSGSNYLKMGLLWVVVVAVVTAAIWLIYRR